MCVAAYTTAHARIRLHKLMTDITDQGGKMYYCDTDSVIFEGATIESGDALGEAANELGPDEHIVTFVSVGAKAYAYRTMKSCKVDTGCTFKVNAKHEMFTRLTSKSVRKTLDKRHFFEDGASLPFGHSKIKG